MLYTNNGVCPDGYKLLYGYKSGYIYQILDKTTGNIYIGKTTNRLSDRMKQHRSGYKAYIEGRSNKYCSSYEIFKNNDYDYEAIEMCKFNDKKYLLQRERFHIDNNECINIMSNKTEISLY